MTNKDIIKMMLTSISYGRDIDIDTFYDTDGNLVYDITAYHTFYDAYDEEALLKIDESNMPDCVSFMCYGMYDFFKEYNDFIIDNAKNIQQDYLFSLKPIKFLTDDNHRHKIINDEIKRKKEVETFIKETKYISDWEKENHPCPQCKLNKKDHWDTIHYNCAEHHTMRCPLLKEFQNKSSEMYREYQKIKRNE